VVPKIILFDYGQTLVNQKPYSIIQGFEAMMPYITVNPDQVTMEMVMALSTKVYKQCEEILGSRNKRNWPLEVAQADIIHYIIEYYHLESEKTEEELAEIYWDGASVGEAVPYTNELMDYLKQAGIRTGVVSNLAYSGNTLRRRLDRLIPSNQFEFVISSRDVIFRKPEPAIFDLAIAKSGVRPEEIWYCGDDTIWDIESSYQTGITPVWFRGALDYEQPIPLVDHIAVEDWVELMEILTRMQKNK